MTTPVDLPAGIVRRAAAITRGPRACPSCECPTFTEPPVPWTDLRDFVVRCDMCERPIAVRVDRSQVVRRGALPATLRRQVDPVAELLDTRGRRAFVVRLAVASLLPITVAMASIALGASPEWVFVLAMAAIVPASTWAPAVVAMAAHSAVVVMRDTFARAMNRPQHPREAVEVVAGRWDQWQREERVRARDRAEHPDAVLVELERVLDDRELRRVRLLVERGEVPDAHLDDLLRFRRTWSVA